MNCKIGFETRMRAGPSPWKKARKPSVRMMCMIVWITFSLRSPTTLGFGSVAEGSDAAMVVRTVWRVCTGRSPLATSDPGATSNSTR